MDESLAPKMANRPEVPVTISISAVSEQETHPVRVTARRAKDALLLAYPQLLPHEDLFVSEITFVGKDVIKTQRIKEKPRERIWLYQHLKAAGLGGDELDGIFYNAMLGDELHTDFLESRTYVPRKVLDGITGGNRLLQETCMNSLAGYLVHQNISLVAHKLDPRLQDDPYVDLWRFMMRRHVSDPFFTERGAKLKGQKQEKFYQYQGGVNSILGRGSVIRDEVRYFAVGARVVCVMKDNHVHIFEFALGRDFDYGVASVLGKPVHQKIVDENSTDPVTKKDLFRPRYESIDMSTARILEILGLSGVELMDAYINSRVPQLYMDCDDSRLDPFDYASLMPEDD